MEKLATKHVLIAFPGKSTVFEIFSKMFGCKILKNTKFLLSQSQVLHVETSKNNFYHKVVVVDVFGWDIAQKIPLFPALSSNNFGTTVSKGRNKVPWVKIVMDIAG